MRRDPPSNLEPWRQEIASCVLRRCVPQPFLWKFAAFCRCFHGSIIAGVVDRFFHEFDHQQLRTLIGVVDWVLWCRRIGDCGWKEGRLGNATYSHDCSLNHRRPTPARERTARRARAPRPTQARERTASNSTRTYALCTMQSFAETPVLLLLRPTIPHAKTGRR